MTIANSELFELCKQVYEATGLADTVDYFYLKNNGDYNVDRATHTQVNHNWWKLGGEVPAGCFPLYTSDYLLEKLSAVTDHVSVKQSNKISIDASNDEKGSWYAHYWFKSRRVQVKSDTPLKALLRLALKLHEEGLL